MHSLIRRSIQVRSKSPSIYLQSLNTGRFTAPIQLSVLYLKMAFVNMDSPIFYAPPVKADFRGDRLTSAAGSQNTSHRGENGKPGSQAVGETESLNPVSSFPREPLGSHSTPGLDREKKSSDNIIPFSCRDDDNRVQTLSSSRVLGISDIAVSNQPAMGETAGE